MGRMSTQAEVTGAIPADEFEMRLAIARAYAGGISAAEAALRVGVSGQTWRNWENGVHSDAARRPAMLRFIAGQLGVDEHWLRHGGPLTPPSEGAPTRNQMNDERPARLRFAEAA